MTTGTVDKENAFVASFEKNISSLALPMNGVSRAPFVVLTST